MVGTKRKTESKTQVGSRHGQLKSRKRFRMVFVKTPGGRTTAQFKKRKPSKAKCAACGIQLAGTARATIKSADIIRRITFFIFCSSS